MLTNKKLSKQEVINEGAFLDYIKKKIQVFKNAAGSSKENNNIINEPHNTKDYNFSQQLDDVITNKPVRPGFGLRKRLVRTSGSNATAPVFTKTGREVINSADLPIETPAWMDSDETVNPPPGFITFNDKPASMTATEWEKQSELAREKGNKEKIIKDKNDPIVLHNKVVKDWSPNLASRGEVWPPKPKTDVRPDTEALFTGSNVPEQPLQNNDPLLAYHAAASQPVKNATTVADLKPIRNRVKNDPLKRLPTNNSITPVPDNKLIPDLAAQATKTKPKLNKIMGPSNTMVPANYNKKAKDPNTGMASTAVKARVPVFGKQKIEKGWTKKPAFSRRPESPDYNEEINIMKQPITEWDYLKHFIQLAEEAEREMRDMEDDDEGLHSTKKELDEKPYSSSNDHRCDPTAKGKDVKKVPMIKGKPVLETDWSNY